MIARYPALLCLVLGALAALGFAPLELWPLTLGCFAAWLWLVHAAPTQRQALWRGWLFGVGHFTISNNWIQHAFDFQDKMPPVLGYGAVVALALYLAVYPMAAAGLAWRMRARRIDAGFVLIAGAAWTLAELLRGWVFTGYAWNPLAVMWVPVQPVASLAAYVGTYALSGLTVTLAGALLLVPRRGLALAGIAAGLAVLVLAQTLSYRTSDSVRASLNAPRLRIVQPGIGQDARGDEDSEPMLRSLIAQSGRPGPAPRLILWPEGVVRDLVEDGYPERWYGWQALPPGALRRRLARVLGPRDVLLFGGNALQFDARGELQTATNSIYALDPAARLTGRYDKAHLVPYGEYLPLPWLLRPLGLARLVPGDYDFRPGPGPRGETLGGFGLIGMQICYEIIFSGEVIDAAHRPRLLFNPSTDAWFGAWGPPQHFAQARLRAIEEGLAVVRATPTGVSGAIGPDGRVLGVVGSQGVADSGAGAVELPLPPVRPATLFARIGNWAALIVTALLAGSGFALRWRRRYRAI